MMSKEFLKKIGVFGVAIGLTASPFALAHAADHGTAPGQEVEDVPSPDGPTDDTFADDPNTSAPVDEREGWEETDGLERGAETEDVPGTQVPSEEAYPGDAPEATQGSADWEEKDQRERGTETEDVPGTDPASSGVETSPGTETQTSPQTEAAPGAAMPDDHPAGAEGEAGFGNGAEPMPGTDVEQDEWEEDEY